MGIDLDEALLHGLLATGFRFPTAGVLVSLEDTIRGFKEIVAGQHDDLPEASFYMVGTIEEAVAKARKMAQEAA